MPTIFIKDDLRRSVEAATGGKMTVLYTATKQPTFMHVVPRFNLDDIDPSLGGGVHPAFIVGGVEKSEIFIGSYPGIVKNGELLSLSGVDPKAAANHDYFVNAARAAGPGFHVTTNAEYAALALWCWKNGYQPRGNTNYGRSHEATYETARRQDGGVPGDVNGTARTLTGSGPASWRHDNTHSGISDLCGNIWEWSPGMRLMDGEIQVIANNDAALNNTDMSRTSTAWRAIRAVDGILVAPGTAGTLKYDATTETGGGIILSDNITNRLGESGSDLNSGNSASLSMKNMTSKEGLNVPAIAKALGLFPVSTEGMKNDGFYMRNFGERLPFRGGGWSSGAGAGVFAVSLSNPRSGASTLLGARPAFVI